MTALISALSLATTVPSLAGAKKPTHEPTIRQKSHLGVSRDVGIVVAFFTCEPNPQCAADDLRDRRREYQRRYDFRGSDDCGRPPETALAHISLGNFTEKYSAPI